VAETIHKVHDRVHICPQVKDVGSKVPKMFVINCSNCGQDTAELNHAESQQRSVKCMVGLFFSYRA
jgi:hypothetical protein